MNQLATLSHPGQISALVQRAASTLAGASSSAEILDARDQASVAYTAAKGAARVVRAKDAHDALLSDLYRVQADALEIESMAKRRLADEIDAAQARGEVARAGQPSIVPVGNDKPATIAEVGLSRKDVFEARCIRDAISSEPGALRRALDDIIRVGDEPTKARLRRELMPAVSNIRAVQTAEKKERRSAREVELAGRIRALPAKRYGLILADPEWRFEPYSRETGMDRAPDNHYPTTPTDDIAARDVASIAADDCVLFMWATAPMLPEALAVMAAWGFRYKTHVVWFKQRAGDGRGPGYWFTGEHELLLLGTRGKVPAPAPGTQWRSILMAPVGEHSEKPEAALELIEEYFPTLPKIELNRRGPARAGWDAWGNEAVGT